MIMANFAANSFSYILQKMRKLTFVLMVMMGATQAQAQQSYAYPYLVFQTTAGDTKTLAVESLTITISDGQLLVSTPDGSQTFSLVDLSKMYFSASNTESGVREVTTGNEQVEVFTTGGVSLGKFETADVAKASLRPGIYLFKSQSKTYKIAVR